MSDVLPAVPVDSGSQAIPADRSLPTIPGYQIQRLIAEGGMATVFLARQISLDRLVALKLLKQFDDPAVAERFPNEGRVVASLSHRNIITIHDLGVVADRYYISMEFLEGGTLQDRVASGGITIEESLGLVEQIGSCLEFAHRKGIVHRDIKPANILFRSDGTPVLSDFGIAKQRQLSKGLTTAGTTLGSPYYLSPEQAEGTTLLDGRTDLYSLGVVLFELLTGKRPYEHTSTMQVILGHLTKPIPSLPPGLAHYQAFLERLMAKQRHERFPTANAMLGELRALRSSETGPTWLVSTVAGKSAVEKQSARRRSRLWWLLAATGAPALALAVWFLATGSDDAPLSPTVKAMPPLATLASLPPQPETFAAEPPQTLVAAARRPEELPSWEIPPFSEMPEELAGSLTPGNIVTEEEPGPVLVDQAPELGVLDRLPEDNLEQSTIPNLMVLAERALQSYRLTTPKGQSANDYYRRVLERDPAHQGARQGLRTIADKYADLVESARRRQQSEEAERYLRRGLAVDSRNARLLTLRTPKPVLVKRRPARPRVREAPKDEPLGFRIQR